MCNRYRLSAKEADIMRACGFDPPYAPDEEYPPQQPYETQPFTPPFETAVVKGRRYLGLLRHPMLSIGRRVGALHRQSFIDIYSTRG